MVKIKVVQTNVDAKYDDEKKYECKVSPTDVDQSKLEIITPMMRVIKLSTQFVPTFCNRVYNTEFIIGPFRGFQKYTYYGYQFFHPIRQEFVHGLWDRSEERAWELLQLDIINFALEHDRKEMTLYWIRSLSREYSLSLLPKPTGTEDTTTKNTPDYR
jgi:hypothetical protein